VWLADGVIDKLAAFQEYSCLRGRRSMAIAYDLDERKRFISPICHRCRHRNLDDRDSCAAFPGDLGIRYEPMSETEAEAFRERVLREGTETREWPARILVEHQRRAS
jgi:hypothetical protein